MPATVAGSWGIGTIDTYYKVVTLQTVAHWCLNCLHQSHDAQVAWWGSNAVVSTVASVSQQEPGSFYVLHWASVWMWVGMVVCLSLSALLYAGYLSMVYPASLLLSAGLSSSPAWNPQVSGVDQWFSTGGLRSKSGSRTCFQWFEPARERLWQKHCVFAWAKKSCAFILKEIFLCSGVPSIHTTYLSYLSTYLSNWIVMYVALPCVLKMHFFVFN